MWWDGARIGHPAGRSVGVVGGCTDRSSSREIIRMVQGLVNQQGDQKGGRMVQG